MRCNFLSLIIMSVLAINGFADEQAADKSQAAKSESTLQELVAVISTLAARLTDLETTISQQQTAQTPYVASPAGPPQAAVFPSPYHLP